MFRAIAPRSFQGTRIAYSADLGGLPLDPEVRAATEAAARLAEDLGAEVVPVDLDFSEADLIFETFRSLDFLDTHMAHLRDHWDLVKQTLKDDISWASAFTAELIAHAASARTALFRQFQALLGDFAMLLAPCVQVLPFPIEWEYPTRIGGVAMDKYYSWQRSCSRITATAMPALAMPMAFSASGLPIGVQFVGPYRGDRLLLEFGLAWEEAVAETAAIRPVL